MSLDDLPENIETELNDITETKSAVVQESSEERFERILSEQRLKNKILRYKVSFGKYLLAYDYKIEQMDELSMDQLERLAQEIEIAVSCRTSGNMLKSYYIGSVQMVEKVAPLLSMNLQGLSAVLENNQAIQETLDELSIKYDVLKAQPPEARLAFLTLQTVMALNNRNKQIDAVKTVVNEPVKKEIIEKYADL